MDTDPPRAPGRWRRDLARGPGGPIELAKEMMASLRSATLPPSQEELLASVAPDIQALTQRKQNPLGDFKPRGGRQVLEELREVDALVTAKAAPQEVEAFRWWPRRRRPPTPARRAGS
jgi:hypothetical protein